MAADEVSNAWKFVRLGVPFGHGTMHLNRTKIQMPSRPKFRENRERNFKPTLNASYLILAAEYKSYLSTGVGGYCSVPITNHRK